MSVSHDSLEYCTVLVTAEVHVLCVPQLATEVRQLLMSLSVNLLNHELAVRPAPATLHACPQKPAFICGRTAVVPDCYSRDKVHTQLLLECPLGLQEKRQGQQRPGQQQPATDGFQVAPVPPSCLFCRRRGVSWRTRQAKEGLMTAGRALAKKNALSPVH